MSLLEELEKDLQELEQLAKSATRNRTKQLIEEDIKKVRQLIEEVI
jgi:Siah interacting protein, N terminal.